MTRFARVGWEEAVVFWFERLFDRNRKPGPDLKFLPSSVLLQSPDCLDEQALVSGKAALSEKILSLKNGERTVFVIDKSGLGARVRQAVPEISAKIPPWASAKSPVYSLYQLPVTTDPLWISEVLAGIAGAFWLVVTFEWLDPYKAKAQIERSRRANAKSNGITNVDSEITFDEATAVLQGLSRGDEKVLKCSWVLVTDERVALDPELFCLEKRPELSLMSALGIRKRDHRALMVRAVSATDLFPSFLDPIGTGVPVLRTRRGLPLYFDPQDGRFEALHWLVAGASGSGKSFFTGLMLKRMIQRETPMSVMFVDHNRSFRKLVKASSGVYFEPESLKDIESDLDSVIRLTNYPKMVVGIELSDLPISEKREAARILLTNFEKFLRGRDTTHPVYLVLDECWNFLRDEPLLVQRMFREFRKLNGAVIAVTQSLSDFLSDESGQAIFQNAPIRVLLRQGEDPVQYRGILGLNDVEVQKLRFLRQERGRFAECMIKTPFSSDIGRLFPVDAEHELLRTDTLRAELIAEAKAKAAPKLGVIKRALVCE